MGLGHQCCEALEAGSMRTIARRLSGSSCTASGWWCPTGGISTDYGTLCRRRRHAPAKRDASFTSRAVQPVAALAFADQGRMLVSGGGDAIVHAWLLAQVLDAEALAGAGCLPLLRPPITLACHNNGRALVCSCVYSCGMHIGDEKVREETGGSCRAKTLHKCMR